MKSRFVPLVIAAVLVFTIVAVFCFAGSPSKSSEWRTERISSGGVRIFRNTAASGNVTVPAEIDGVPVRIVGNGAFMGFSGITKVTIPEGVRAIGRNAFSGCTQLKLVKIGNVDYIAEDAFSQTPRLHRIVGPGFEYVWGGGGWHRKETHGRRTSGKVRWITLIALCIAGMFIGLGGCTRTFARHRLQSLFVAMRNGWNHVVDRFRRLDTNGRSEISFLTLDLVSVPGKTFKMGKFEVTQRQWQSLMDDNPSYHKSPECPVENVSLSDCQTFMERLNATPEAKAANLIFRLPTEEEWEFACRAGETGPYCKDSKRRTITDETLGRVAWFKNNSRQNTHPVGGKLPNNFGLYDMLGNVWEWTQSCEDDIYVIRGGSYNSSAEDCESSSRTGAPISFHDNDLGFRLCADRKDNRKTVFSTEDAVTTAKDTGSESSSCSSAEEVSDRQAEPEVPV